ncbi:unnamed protein product [Auanema sp. JU1783]|nr:unnamed protein product [Auanema sp. JU1783]
MNRILAARSSFAFLRTSSNIAKPPAGSQSTAVFDTKTHTGQAWDSKDYRLQRFDTAQKQVNPNVAMNLVAERPAQDCGHERVVYCDGGHPALGHPRVFINLDKPGVHACGYCGNRFYNSHVTKGEDLETHHLNC